MPRRNKKQTFIIEVATCLGYNRRPLHQIDKTLSHRNWQISLITYFAKKFIIRQQKTSKRRQSSETKQAKLHVYAWFNSVTNATIACKTFGVDRSSSFRGEQPNGNCVVCWRRSSAYFVEYLQMYWTDFRNLYTIWNWCTCRWWICTLFSNLSRDVAMVTKQCCCNEGKYYVHSLHVC